jgi:hypothetical protein
MVDDELTRQLRPVFTYSTTVIPLSPRVEVVCVWDDGEEVGPLQAVAVMQPLVQLAIQGHIETVDAPGKKHKVMFAGEPPIDNFDSADLLDRIESLSPLYLLIGPETTAWDTPWIDAKYVFFDGATATSASRSRKRKWAEDHVEKVQPE